MCHKYVPYHHARTGGYGETSSTTWSFMALPRSGLGLTLGLVVNYLVLHRVAQVVECVLVLRRERDRLLVAADRLLERAKLLQRVACCCRRGGGGGGSGWERSCRLQSDRSGRDIRMDTRDPAVRRRQGGRGAPRLLYASANFGWMATARRYVSTARWMLPIS